MHTRLFNSQTFLNLLYEITVLVTYLLCSTWHLLSVLTVSVVITNTETSISSKNNHNAQILLHRPYHYLIHVLVSTEHPPEKAAAH